MTAERFMWRATKVKKPSETASSATMIASTGIAMLTVR